MPNSDPDAGIGNQASPSESALEALTLHLPLGSIVETLPNSFLLFSPTKQEIHQLNEGSVLLARRLLVGGPLTALADELSVLGVEQPIRSEWVMSFLRELSRLQLLEAEWRTQAPAAPFTQIVSLAGIAMSIAYESGDLFSSIGSAFSHLASDQAEVSCEYRLFAAGEFVLVSRDGGRSMVVARAEAGTILKSMILEEVLRAADQLCALHAACLQTGEGAILLLGSPGAGKSTLSIALLREGLGYLSDDVTLVVASGKVSGVALAPSVKQGTWELLRAADPSMEDLPVHLRPDGQVVRFLPVEACATAEPLTVAMVVRLRRSPGATARLDPIGSAEALADVLRDARSPDSICSADIFHAVADLVRGARCVELTYGEAAEAAAAIRNYDYG